MRTRLLSYLALGALALAGACKLGPDYERPDAPIPPSFRSAPPEIPASPSLGELEWFEVFDDPALQSLIEQALTNNYDLRIAAERILAAREIVDIEGSELLPTIDVGAQYTRNEISKNTGIGAIPDLDRHQNQYSVFGNVSWELDFWGRIRSATDAARADLLATELGRRAVVQTLLTDIATAYFDLLELDEELHIARETYESRQASFKLVSLRLEEGVASKVDYLQSESLVLQTAAFLPSLESAIETQENLIRVLVGANPGPIQRGKTLLEQRRGMQVPIGLPSALLERRPDIGAAEARLVATNARIGEAKALLYPTIALTGSGGLLSRDFSDLFRSDSTFLDFGPSIVLPIFNNDRLRSNVRVTESQQREAAMAYMQTVQQAFREVADALIQRQKITESREWRERLEETLSDQLSLSNERYLGGVTSYLEVLDSERVHFDAEINLARAIRDELLAHVFLYRALGGGWQGAEERAAEGPQTGASESDLASHRP